MIKQVHCPSQEIKGNSSDKHCLLGICKATGIKNKLAFYCIFCFCKQGQNAAQGATALTHGTLHPLGAWPLITRALIPNELWALTVTLPGSAQV